VDESTKSEVFKIFKADFDTGRFGFLKNLLGEYGALEYAMGRAREFTDRARLELSIFPDASSQRSLTSLLDYVLERNR